ncbi:MAG: hypothetical protein Q4D85_13270 [Corynebacterium sp.]|nr:hypothetical protein [Corynebacterium sp.]MDO5099704.1 hypothetical protein [Corynebacterium sp.]
MLIADAARKGLVTYEELAHALAGKEESFGFPTSCKDGFSQFLSSFFT